MDFFYATYYLLILQMFVQLKSNKMKKLLLIPVIALLLSCEKENCNEIHDAYIRSLNNATTQPQIDEITRQYHNALNKADC